MRQTSLLRLSLLVAAAGLPEPRKDHAAVMARFALDCNNLMAPLVKQLEVDLGPDTGDLKLRTGLHSGPVTAGVLRGERARFQLFGDTVNTCSRIESTGKAGRIHVSQTTADILVNSGKAHWLVARTDKVVAKGKGELQTFWLSPEEDKGSHQGEVKPNTVDLASEPVPSSVVNSKTTRLINWNADIALRLLRQIAARRQQEQSPSSSNPTLGERQGTAIDEVKEIISLPTFCPVANAQEVDPENLELDDAVDEELRDFITASKSSILSRVVLIPFRCRVY